MDRVEINSFLENILPAFALPVVLVAFVVCVVSDRIVGYFCEEKDVK